MSTDLLALAAELVAIPSVSRHECALADYVEESLRGCAWLDLERIGDNVIAQTHLARDHRVVIAGHLDTVPGAGNEAPRLDGEILYGLGAADMKGGIAVMLDLARSVCEPAVDITWCFYRGEEIERSENGLMQISDSRPELLKADAAILCEPTNCRIEAGCQGTLRVRIELAGKRAHTARPHLGRNAIHRLGPLLARVSEWQPRSVVLEGCEYIERLQVVSIEGGGTGNVVPDRASATINFRFAPDRDLEAATRYITGLFADLIEPDGTDVMHIIDMASAAPPALDDPFVAHLLETTGRPPRAKVGWTDVATFAAWGVPATNFGPGDPELAHQLGEYVEKSSLERARASLHAVIAP